MDKVKILTFALLLIIYEYILLFYNDYAHSYIFKLLPSCIFIWFLIEYKFKNRKIIFSAVLFSMLGDLLLDIDVENLFLFGLISFAIAHILYSLFFLYSYNFDNNKLLVKIILIPLSAIVMGIVFGNVPNELQIPVWFYIFIIFSLVFIICIRKKINFLVVIGVFLFIISDLILAIDKFIYPIEIVLMINIIFYLPAQFLIVYGTVLDKRE